MVLLSFSQNVEGHEQEWCQDLSFLRIVLVCLLISLHGVHLSFPHVQLTLVISHVLIYYLPQFSPQFTSPRHVLVLLLTSLSASL